MAEHLRFAVCYWHTFCNAGARSLRPRYTHAIPGRPARRWRSSRGKVDAAFEFFTKLGVPYYCFHDIDLAPDADDIGQYEKNLKHMVALANERQQATGVKLLWGTANLFSHPRYMNGAATNPDFNVVARAAVQVKAAIEATVELGGEHYVFWGGREGYATLVNTDMKRELAHMAPLPDHGARLWPQHRLQGQLLHRAQADGADEAPVRFRQRDGGGFLREHGLEQDFKLNIEANHATLAGHTFEHDLQVASDHGLLGSIDANRGNAQNGWDTDQFPTDLYDTVARCWWCCGRAASHRRAELRRQAAPRIHRLEDLFIAHIGGMDAFARGLLIAQRVIADGKLQEFKRLRYASFDGGKGKDFERGKMYPGTFARPRRRYGRT